jgi:methyltransferase (TIGR00027 family)
MTHPVRSPSRTAQFMALFRALESARPAGERLFDDPLARAFLPWSLRPLPQLARVRPGAAGIAFVIDRRWPGARASGIARTRLIDDHLEEALAAGAEQVVIVGAGFDSRAYRIGGIERARVFEVDHPDTASAKRALLAERLGELPGHVRFVEADLNQASLGAELERAGHRAGERTFFVWEGVTNYLSADGVDTTMRAVRDAGAPGSRLAFTYIHRGLLDGSAEFEGAATVAEKVRREGEPWTFGLLPDEVADYLAERGMRLLEDVGSVEYRRRFMPGEGAHLRGYEFYRVALAEVSPRPARREPSPRGPGR